MKKSELRQIIKGEGLPTDVIGAGINLDDGATFEFVSNKFDSNAFDTLYETLLNALYTIAQIPSIAVGRTDINKIYIKNDDLAIFESKEKIDQFVSAIINNFYSKLLKKLSTESINIDTLNTNVLDTNYPSDSIT